MTSHFVNLELDEDREWTAHSVELPGCTWYAPTKGEAVHLASEKVIEFCLWLCSHGERGVPETIARFQVAEEGHGTWTSDDYFADCTFESDLQPASRSDIKRSVRWLGYSRKDLLALVDGLDDKALQTSTGSPGKLRTVESMLEHIADVEWWYLHNLRLLQGARPSGSCERNGLGYLSSVRHVVCGRLDETSEEERELIVTTSAQEQWTLRKVLRRLIWHERYHTAGIESDIQRGGA